VSTHATNYAPRRHVVAHLGAVQVPLVDGFEVVCCRGQAELLALLQADATISSVLLDARAIGVDRDLFHHLEALQVRALVRDSEPARTDWMALGAQGVVSVIADEHVLAAVLRQAIGAADRWRPLPPFVSRPGGCGPLIVVAGPSCRSTARLAMKVAAGAVRPNPALPVILTDLEVRGWLRDLHDAPGETVGIQDLVDLHRTRVATRDEVAQLAPLDHDCGYRILFGVRHPRDWLALGPRSVRSALASLRHHAGALVAVVGDDLDGEAETGSADLEDRNHLARSAVLTADLILVAPAHTNAAAHAQAILLEDLAHLRPDAVTVVVPFGAGNDPSEGAPPLPDAVERAISATMSCASRSTVRGDVDLAGVLVRPGELGHWRTPGQRVPSDQGDAGWMTPRVPQQP